MGDISVHKLASGASAITHVFNEVPTGTVNGVNTDFVLAATPITNSLNVYLNGARLQITTDYTLATATITFLTAPLLGSVILCDYQY